MDSNTLNTLIWLVFNLNNALVLYFEGAIIYSIFFIKKREALSFASSKKYYMNLIFLLGTACFSILLFAQSYPNIYQAIYNYNIVPILIVVYLSRFAYKRLLLLFKNQAYFETVRAVWLVFQLSPIIILSLFLSLFFAKPNFFISNDSVHFFNNPHDSSSFDIYLYLAFFICIFLVLISYLLMFGYSSFTHYKHKTYSYLLKKRISTLAIFVFLFFCFWLFFFEQGYNYTSIDNRYIEINRALLIERIDTGWFSNFIEIKMSSLLFLSWLILTLIATSIKKSMVYNKITAFLSFINFILIMLGLTYPFILISGYSSNYYLTIWDNQASEFAVNAFFYSWLIYLPIFLGIYYLIIKLKK